MNLYYEDIERYILTEGRKRNIPRLFHFAFRQRQKARNLPVRAFWSVIVRVSLIFSASYIPRFSCAGGLCFPHMYGIVISYNTIIGKNCTIYQGVTIGQDRIKYPNEAPVIGDNVMIGAGAKIIGPVKIGNNVKIGANCVVVTNVPDDATVVLHKPKIIIKNHTRT